MPNPSPPRRRLTLVDGMALIAATAVGLGAMRARSGDLSPMLEMVSNVASLKEVFGLVVEVTFFGFPLFATWTVALLILRLRAPRPSRRRLACQPGAMALASATLVVALRLLEYALMVLETVALWGSDWSFAAVSRAINVLYANMTEADTSPGLAVAAAWLTLIVGGRWRPEPTWIDRAGRLAGLAWLLLLLSPFFQWIAFSL
jgi:hypothetical protein